MNFLFLYEILSSLGGTEVLISRMTGWLVNQGHSVTLVVATDGIERRLIDSRVKIVVMGSDYHRLGHFHHARSILKRHQIERPDVIKSFESLGAWCATQIGRQFSPASRVIHGFYYPTFDPPVKFLGIWPLRLFTSHIMSAFAPGGMLFISECQAKNFQAIFGLRHEGRIWPLPVDSGDFDGLLRSPQWGRIVSIGRLAPMKEYNFYMIGVVRDLVDRGFDVRWDVYGDGPFLESMMGKVASAGLDSRITFHGRLPHEDFGKALETAYVFVGMGTALIEAALCRVPGPVAIAYDDVGLTYGPVYCVPFGNFGDTMPTPPKHTVLGEISRLLDLDTAAYSEEMALTRSAAERYGLDQRMEEFLQIARRAPAARVSWGRVLLFELYHLVLRMRRLAFGFWHRLFPGKCSGSL